MANKDAHAIWSYADIPLDEKPSAEGSEAKKDHRRFKMASSIIDSVDELEEWMKMNEDRLNRLVEGQGTSGTRLASTKSGDNDKIEQEGGRTVRRFHLQLNSDARNPTLKAMANKDAHAIWSYADIPLDEEPSAEGSEAKKAKKK
ncbi:hypothetical protein E4U38_004775 [Claviceps purpurea]|nr:hypothetical protein E4U38_004775 [Claviceps purpurea]